jgi:hypothetical protein
MRISALIVMEKDLNILCVVGMGVLAMYIVTNDVITQRSKMFMVVVIGGLIYYMGVPATFTQSGGKRDIIDIHLPRKTKKQLSEHMDTALWTMRNNPDEPKLQHKHLNVRCGGKLAKQLRALAKVGRKFGLSNFVNRSATVLDAFFKKYHWVMLYAANNPKLASTISTRTLQTLQDMRKDALNSLQDIIFRTPRVYDKTVVRTTMMIDQELHSCITNVVNLVLRIGNKIDIAKIQAARFLVDYPVAFDHDNKRLYG